MLTYRPESLEMVDKVPDEVIIQIRAHQIGSGCCEINKHQREGNKRGRTAVPHPASLVP